MNWACTLVCFKFPGARLCQKLAESDEAWQRYHKNKKGAIFETQCIPIINVDRITSDYENRGKKSGSFLLGHPVITLSFHQMGVSIGNDLSVGQHVQRLVTSCAQAAYAWANLPTFVAMKLNLLACDHVIGARIYTDLFCWLCRYVTVI